MLDRAIMEKINKITAQMKIVRKEKNKLDLMRDKVYGFDAETFEAESPVKKYGMIAAGVITAFALLPEIKKRF